MTTTRAQGTTCQNSVFFHFQEFTRQSSENVGNSLVGCSRHKGDDKFVISERFHQFDPNILDKLKKKSSLQKQFNEKIRLKNMYFNTVEKYRTIILNFIKHHNIDTNKFSVAVQKSSMCPHELARSKNVALIPT